MSKMAFHEYQRLTHQWHGRALEILRDLKSTYYQLFAVQRMIGVSREIEGTLRSMVKNTQSRVASDQAMASDATLGQTEIAKILTERQALFQRQKELSAKLKQILADFSVEEIRLPEKLESPSWDAELKSLMETAQTLHPSIQGSQQQVEQTRWGVKSAKRDYIPDFQVQSEYVQRPGGRVDAFTGELMLNVPLILRKKNRQLQQAEAELASAQFNKQNTMNSVFAKIQEIHAKMKASQAMLNINRRTYLPQARQAFQMTSRAYSTGQVGFVDVLSAVRMLFDAQTEYWKAFEEQAASVFELEEAVGLTREEYASFKKE
jgi:outer membrane protein TolC